MYGGEKAFMRYQPARRTNDESHMAPWRPTYDRDSIAKTEITRAASASITQLWTTTNSRTTCPSADNAHTGARDDECPEGEPYRHGQRHQPQRHEDSAACLSPVPCNYIERRRHTSATYWPRRLTVLQKSKRPYRQDPDAEPKSAFAQA